MVEIQVTENVDTPYEDQGIGKGSWSKEEKSKQIKDEIMKETSVKVGAYRALTTYQAF